MYLIVMITLLSFVGYGIYRMADKYNTKALEKEMEQRRIDKEREQEEERKRKLEKQREEEHEREKRLREIEIKGRPQRALEKRYAEGQLIEEVLELICDGNINSKPKIIYIYNSQIVAVRDKQKLVYDFASNRVHNLQPVNETFLVGEITEFVKPQMALAGAINSKLGYGYRIEDKAEYEIIFGEEENFAKYTSNYVEMKLESTLPNRSF